MPTVLSFVLVYVYLARSAKVAGRAIYFFIVMLFSSWHFNFSQYQPRDWLGRDVSPISVEWDVKP